MNKRRRAALVRHGGLMDAEAAARAVNAQPWEPMQGMVKLRCQRCRYFFAAPPGAEESRCPDCVGLGQRAAKLA